jgi:hypothetical protein
VRFLCLRFDGGAFDTVAGKGFGDELNQTFHKGLLVPQSSWPVRKARTHRQVPFDESPEGMPGQPKPGEVTACSIRSGGMGSPQRDDSEPPRLRIAMFFGLAPFSRGLKKSYGMLNVLPPVVPVKRIHLHIVA